MNYPATSDQLRKAGYLFDNEAHCRGNGCGEKIEWWLTPTGAKMPMTVLETVKPGLFGSQ